MVGMGLNAGLKALNAARLSIQTAGQNVANANTPGYSRQRVLQSGALPFTMSRGLQIGTGVDIDNISRLVDGGLERRISLQLSVAGNSEMVLNRLRELEGILGEPDNGLSTDFIDLFGKLGSLATDPSDRSLRGGAIQSARTLSDSFNLISSRYRDLSENTTAEIQGLTRLVNEKASQMAQLNAQIISLESNGSAANDLRDERGRIVAEIAELVDVRALERSTGSLDLLVGGRLVVSGSRSSTITAVKGTSGETELRVGSTSGIRLSGGKIGALMQQEGAKIPELLGNFDELSRNLILSMNRLHTTGVPGNGPFTSLIGAVGVADTDGDGDRGDELLASAGTAFDIQAGELFVSVTNQATGDIERTRIAIDPIAMTLQDLAAEITSIDRLTANVDPAGRLRINAESGYGFDFASRLDASPDTFGSFGGGAPTLGSTNSGPFDLSAAPANKSFTVTVNGTPETVTLDAADFSNPAQATLEELVAAINADLTQATADSVGGRLVIRSNLSGAAATMSMADTGGTPLANLGMATGPASGQDTSVQPSISGIYSGSANGQLSFVPDGDGVIGTTPGLTISVFDQNGAKVATLAVGDSYDPDIDPPLDVVDGVRVSFSRGAISSSNNEVFALDTIADSDTSDVLVALGMNSFFLGDDASTIEVNPELLRDPGLLAAGLSSASGDADNLSRMMSFRDEGVGDLDNSSIEDFYTRVVSDLGFDIATAETSLDSQQNLLERLEQERESVSGVNLDEEMVDLVRFQQAFEAASRFIDTVNQLTSDLINLGR